MEIPTGGGFLGCPCSAAQLVPTLCDPVDCQSPKLLCPQNFAGKNTGVGCHFLFQLLGQGNKIASLKGEESRVSENTVLIYLMSLFYTPHSYHIGDSEQQEHFELTRGH